MVLVGRYRCCVIDIFWWCCFELCFVVLWYLCFVFWLWWYIVLVVRVWLYWLLLRCLFVLEGFGWIVFVYCLDGRLVCWFCWFCCVLEYGCYYSWFVLVGWRLLIGWFVFWLDCCDIVCWIFVLWNVLYRCEIVMVCFFGL